MKPLTQLAKRKRRRTPGNREDPHYVRAVGKALEALDVLRRATAPLSLGELAARLGLGKSSAFRILHTLEANRYIRRSFDGRYELEPQMASHGPRPLLPKLLEAAREPLRELVREFRESVGLAMLFDNHIQVVYVIESPEVVRMGNTLGRIIPPHASALGKTIAAFQNEEKREKLLRSYGIVRFTPNTITDERQLREEFDRIVARGYAVDAEESTLHGYCFAAPVRAPDGEVIAAISISPPMVRLNEQIQAKMIERIVETAQRISEALRSG